MLPRMRPLIRSLAAVAMTALAAIGVAERAALHAHPLEESDLVPHALMLVERAGDCPGVIHFDAALRGDHPVCVECALAASSIAAGASADTWIAYVAPSRRGMSDETRGHEALGDRSGPARAPPAA